MALEVEARFRADRSENLERLTTLPTLGDALLGAPRVVMETDRYLDTEDGRLAAARWACRLRARDGAVRISLKGPPEEPTTGWLHRRPEVEAPATPDTDPTRWPPSPARHHLEQLSGGAPLIERLTLEQRRVERDVAADGRSVGTLSLDTVMFERAGVRGGPLHLVELEIAADATDAVGDLRSLAEALAAEPGLTPEPLTKLEIALGAR